MKEALEYKEHAFIILVPLSEEAQERMDQYNIYDGGEVAECFKSMVFGQETEEYLEVRLFDLINAKLDILINIYEEEVIENKDVMEVLELTQGLIDASDDEKFVEFATEFTELLKTAIAYKTDVGFYF